MLSREQRNVRWVFHIFISIFYNKTWFNSASTEEQLNGACGGAEANGLSGAEGGGQDSGGEEEEVPVDENLFTGEDLEELDEELNTLALEDWGARDGN